jgi:uncharacterized protein
VSTPRGIIVRDAHYPGRAPIDAYGDGGFRFAGMSHRGAVLCLPSGIHGWAPREPADLDEMAFARVREEAAAIELLLIGTGTSLAPLPDALRWSLGGAGVRVETMATGAAVRTYNVLLAEGRAVAAGLLPVD